MPLSKIIFISALLFCSKFSLLCQTDTLKSEYIDTTTFVMKKSPTSALLYSIIPGGGQLYVGSYIKAPLFFGAAATMGTFIVINNNKFIENRDLATSLVNPAEKQQVESGNGEFNKLPLYSGNSYQLSLAKQRKEFYRDNRDRLIMYSIVLYAVSMIDAYVGAHLYDFDVKDNIGLNYNPQTNGMNLVFSYPIY